MAIPLHLVPLAGFAGLMTPAAVEDFRRLMIPNALTLALCVLSPLHLAPAPTTTLAAALGPAGGGCAALSAAAPSRLYARRAPRCCDCPGRRRSRGSAMSRGAPALRRRTNRWSRRTATPLAGSS